MEEVGDAEEQDRLVGALGTRRLQLRPGAMVKKASRRASSLNGLSMPGNEGAVYFSSRQARKSGLKSSSSRMATVIFAAASALGARIFKRGGKPGGGSPLR